MWRRLVRGRKHFVRLPLMGVAVGLLVGVAFQDLLFGAAAGAVIGLVLALMFALQTN